MKRIISILLGVVISVTVMGQRTQKNQQKIESLKKHKSIEVFQSRNTEKRHTHFHIIASQSDFLKSTQTIKQRLDNSIYEYWYEGTSQWINDWKEEYTYDASGNLSLYIGYEVDGSTNQWVADDKEEYTYDVNRNLILFIDYEWDGSTIQWINDWKEEYTYDANRNLTFYIGYEWDESASQWVAYDKEEYTYDVNGNLILFIDYAWDESISQWVNDWKKEYTYDANGNMTLSIEYRWDVVISQWINDWKEEYTCDANGKVTLSIGYYWDESTNQWISDLKAEYSYDANSNPSLEFYSYWDESTSQWITEYKYEYTYDFTYDLSDLLLPSLYWFLPDYPMNITNMPIDFISYDFEAKTWVESWKGTYYYSEVDVSVSEISELDIKVFPNPAEEFIVFKIDNISTSTTIEIFDIQGKKVLSQLIFNNKQIYTHHLNKGLYLFKLNTNGTIYKGKIMIE